MEDVRFLISFCEWRYLPNVVIKLRKNVDGVATVFRLQAV